MEYEINYDTQIIMPVGDNSSKIIESDEEYFVKRSVQNIMEHSCEYFGSSFEGRKEGTKKLLGITHKSPIIIEETRKIIFFPTTSPDNWDCIWINLEKIDKYYKIDNKTSEILFKNGDKIKLNVSIGSLSNQILRATRLKYILEERIDQKKDNYL
jgi:competence protein ComK